MKKLHILILASLLLLSSCNGSGNSAVSGSGNAFGADADFQKNFHNGNFGRHIACESDTGYYVLSNYFLYYIEKGSMEATVACGKLDCKHDDEDCNAYLEALDIAYNDGKIYFLNEGRFNTVFSMDLDGTNRKEVVSYKPDNSSSFIVHRGHIYFIEDQVLYAVPLTDTNSKKELHRLTETADISSAQLWADEDDVFVQSEDKDYVQAFFKYSIPDNTYNRIWSFDKFMQDWNSQVTGINGWYINDDMLYCYMAGEGVWKYNLVSGENTRITDEGDKLLYGYASFDDDHIYINMTNEFDIVEYKIVIYDYQGKLINEISLADVFAQNNCLYYSIIGSSAGLLFGGQVSPEQTTINLKNGGGWTYNIESFSYMPIPNNSQGVIPLNLTTQSTN